MCKTLLSEWGMLLRYYTPPKRFVLFRLVAQWLSLRLAGRTVYHLFGRLCTLELLHGGPAGLGVADSKYSVVQC